MNPVQYALKLVHDAREMKDTPANKKYQYFYENHPDFTNMYPLVVKYFCLYGIFNAPLFQELNTKRENERPDLMGSLVMQTDYIKGLLVANNVSKIQAKKIANQELAEAETQLNKIRNQTKEIKKKIENEKKNNDAELRKEMLDFVEKLPEDGNL